ncbi:hypothetical protein CKO_03299 [Citrobacter koseri ATCC BAA-895]|uniref:Uncharacterized protein n=1 Tax=Citrobacter koseri (strain ATCC BAA-895 / CDC 4225-83 / SGSC4696) TaxID=290338 RepID=A8ALM0_CITK8|nr:hypothetical protein CKO_03299 [Citrobacter koseri ATCC BAA-895]
MCCLSIVGLISEAPSGHYTLPDGANAYPAYRRRLNLRRRYPLAFFCEISGNPE